MYVYLLFVSFYISAIPFPNLCALLLSQLMYHIWSIVNLHRISDVSVISFLYWDGFSLPAWGIIINKPKRLKVDILNRQCWLYGKKGITAPGWGF